MGEAAHQPEPEPDPLAEVVRRVARSVVPPTDVELWERVRGPQEDIVALTELYRRWHSPLLMLGRRRGASAEGTEEVVNTAFVVLLRRRGQIPTPPHAMAYLRRCVGRAANRVRETEQKRVVRETTTPDVGDFGTEAPDPIALEELSRAVDAALAQLSERQREAVVLHHFLGWTCDQVAAALGVQPSTINTHLDQGREKLRSALAKWNPRVAAGGGVGVALTDAARSSAMSPEKLAATVASILARVAKTHWVKPSLVFVGFAVLGVTWTVVGTRPQTVVERSPVETVPQRNLRIFRTLVEPEAVRSLRPLVIGQGQVRLARVDVSDTRIIGRFELRHTLPGGSSARSELHIRYETQRGDFRVTIDLLGEGKHRDIDPTKAIVWWKNPLTGKELSSQVQPLQQALSAFRLIPTDAASEGERAAFTERLRRSAYMGRWYRGGDPGGEHRIDFVGGTMRITGPQGHWSEIDWASIRFEGASGAHSFHGITLSPDGQRLNFENGDWWTREPVKKP